MMIHYTGSISRSVGSYWFSCIFAGTIVASSLPRLIVPVFASSGWRNRIWTLMRFPLGTSTWIDSHEFDAALQMQQPNFSLAIKVPVKYLRNSCLRFGQNFPNTTYWLTSTITSESLPIQYVSVLRHCLQYECMTIQGVRKLAH